MSENQQRSTDERIANLTAWIQDFSARLEHIEAELQQLKGQEPEVSEDVMIAISAAVAAYLGKRATVKQVRLSSRSSAGSAWAAQGRTNIQLSHQIRPSR